MAGIFGGTSAFGGPLIGGLLGPPAAPPASPPAAAPPAPPPSINNNITISNPTPAPAPVAPVPRPAAAPSPALDSKCAQQNGSFGQDQDSQYEQNYQGNQGGYGQDQGEEGGFSQGSGRPKPNKCSKAASAGTRTANMARASSPRLRAGLARTRARVRVLPRKALIGD
ncbi:hypothetical protein ABVK25_006064 [Lepraria finkii]|uniref:Uncharacterized protein n=1 Tax=Lepraria finkii TaxID=1340010 RepID=A0ABR4B7B7_9LECA